MNPRYSRRLRTYIEYKTKIFYNNFDKANHFSDYFTNIADALVEMSKQPTKSLQDPD